MAIDRSKFKGSSVNQMKQNDQSANKITGKGQRERADTLEIEEGRNRFRIYPVHPGNEKDGDAPENAVFSETSSKVFLPCWVQEKDKDGNPVMEKGRPKMKLSVKPVFNGKLHGGLEKDLVEEYIRLAKEMAEQMQDKTERQQFLDKIYGKYHADAKYRLPGCSYTNTAVMYADKLVGETANVEKFGRLEVKNGVKIKMNKKAATESATDPLGVDPFSDPESGLPVIITFNKPQPNGPKIQPNDIYDVDIDKQFDRKTKLLTEYPISDESLEKFLTFPPLWKLFRNSFKKKDFQLQLEGLQTFDEQYDIGIFETDEFTAIAEEIASYFPEGDEDETAAENAPADAVEDAEEDIQQDEFDLMNRVELQSYNRKMKLGVVIKPTMSDDAIRKAMRDAVVDIPHDPLPGEEGYVEPEVEKKNPLTEIKKTPIAKPVIKEPIPPAATSGSAAKDRLAALRGKK